MYWNHRKDPQIHLVGIGGSGMSAIAEVLLHSKFKVTGSDSHRTTTTDRLSSLGAVIFEGHKASHIKGATCVVVSSAISRTNPEWVAAQEKGIPVIPRAEMLAELMRLKMGVAVAGAHGKTTTTTMLGQFLESIDPTVVVGSRVSHWNASSRVGRGDAFVIEADESDRSFLKFSPVYSIVTNIDREHLDTYKDLDDIENTFLDFLNRTAFFGMNWLNADCPSLRRIRSKISKPTKTFGFDERADLRVTSVVTEGLKTRFSLQYEGESLGEFEIPIVGHHNVMNASAAIGVCLSLGLQVKTIQAACKKFVSADRRLQIHLDTSAEVVIEDYGHHPTEIEATLKAVQQAFPDSELTVIFQPHRFTRTKTLWNEFSECFRKRCDLLLLLPIYAAHEAAIPGVTSQELAKNMREVRVTVLDEMPNVLHIQKHLLPANGKRRVTLVLGAGPLTKLAQDLAAAWASKAVLSG